MSLFIQRGHLHQYLFLCLFFSEKCSFLSSEHKIVFCWRKAIRICYFHSVRVIRYNIIYIKMLRRNPSHRGKYEMPLEENHLGGINNMVSPGNRYDCINN